jgi:hypothetical protein
MIKVTTVRKEIEAIVTGTMSQPGVIVASRAFVSKSLSSQAPQNYELANTLQLKPIFNLRKLTTV